MGQAAWSAAGVTYLLDANVFIEAKKRYYGFDICPGFWAYLEREMAAGSVRSLDAVKRELVAQADELSAWATAHEAFFDTPTAKFAASMTQVGSWVTGPNLTYSQGAVAEFLAKADSQLVAHAHAEGLVLVTDEGTHPRSVKRVMIPDACDAVGVAHMSTFQFLRLENVRFQL